MVHTTRLTTNAFIYLHTRETREHRKYFEMAAKVCTMHGVHVTFEEVLPGGNCLGVNVVHGKDVFPGAAAGAIDAGPAAADATASRNPPNPGVWGPYKKKAARTTTQAERDGLQEMVTAIGKAFQRAKARGSKYRVFHSMTLPTNKFSTLSMVRFLQKEDPADYRPGVWFDGSKFAKIQNPSSFNKLMKLVEEQVDAFKWVGVVRR